MLKKIVITLVLLTGCAQSPEVKIEKNETDSLLIKSKETIEKTVNIHYQTMQMASESIPYPDLQRLKPLKADIVSKIDVRSFNTSLLQLLKYSCCK